MEIRFISSLTPDDENRLAAAVLGVVTAVVEQYSLAYTIRIATADGRVFHHTHVPAGDRWPAVALPGGDRVFAPATDGPADPLP